MPRRYFNWKLAIVLVIGIGVLGVTAFGLRQWQRTNRAEQGLVLGNKAYDEQKWEQAAANLGRHLAVEPDDVPALLKYAEAQLKIRPSKRNNIQQAILAYRAVLRADKNNSEAAMRLTEVYLMMGMPGEAELIASRQLETNDDPELRRILALALARQRKFNEAAAQLKTILQEHPDQILAYETLGQLIEQRPDDFPDSNDWFNEAVKNNPSSALAYIVRAGFHRRANDSTKALSDLEQAEKQDLSDPNVELRLAGEFIYANNLDKAEQHLTAVQTATPADQGLWAIWAQLALKSQSQEKMLKVAETGLKELSSQPWDFMPMATELFIRCGQLDRAADCISEMNQKDVSPVTVAFLEGLVAAERGHLFEAIKYWQQSMGLGNTSSQVRLALSSVLSRLGNTQLALGHLRTLVSERPNLFSGHLALAKLLAQTGNWAKVAEHAATAMRLSPKNPEPVLLYLQARMQSLTAVSTSENAQTWQDIEKQLSTLDKTTNGSLEVKLLQFQLALRQGNFANAQALVTQLKKDHPSQIRIAMAEAELLDIQDKINEAISILHKTIEEFPHAIEPVRYLAILLARQGDQEKCEAIIKDALARIDQPITQRTLGLLLAEFYTQWNQKDNVYSLLNTLAQKLPEDIPLKRGLLLCEQVIKDPEKAQQLVNDIKLLEGEDGWQWRYEQAKLWFAADDFEARYPQVVSFLQENLQANPNDQASRILLARAYDRSGELQLAISTCREAVSRSPDDLRIIIPTVAALYKAKEYDEADQLLNRVSQQKHPQLQQLQLQSYLRHGQLSLASDILQDFISNDPNNQANRFSLALLKTQQAKFDEAGELLDELKAQSPNSLPITYAQVQLNIRQDKPEEALRICDELINNLNNASAYILRARTYTRLKQIDKAAEDIEQATAIEPNNIEVWIASSEFYRSIGRSDKAIADIEQALTLGSSDVQTQKLAISLLFASGDAEKVRQGKAILDEALQSNPDDIDLRLFKANSLLTEGTAPAIENATRILQKITEDQPEISQAWALLGEISLRQGQLSKAMDAALRGLAHTPNDRTLLLLKARTEAARLPVLAIATLKMLLELDPNNTDAAVFLANTYIATGEPRKAVNLLKAQLVSRAGTPEGRRINIALAVALHKNGNKADAQKEFDSLIQSEPNDPIPLLAQVPLLKDDKLWNELSQKVTDWYQKHPEDSRTPIFIARNLVTTEDSQARKTAEHILRIMLKIDSDSIETMTALAILLHTIGRPDESVPLYQQTLQLEPDNLIVINNLAWIMCEEQGKFQEALELAQRGLQISPNYIDLIDTRGVAYYRLGEFNKAIEDFTTCIKLYPDGTLAAISSRFHLARAFAKLGQKDKAVEHLNQALNLYQALDPANRIGALSDTDLDEAQRLLKQLQEDG
jgi:tetratricopeptide (TPR) repeat protein